VAKAAPERGIAHAPRRVPITVVNATARSFERVGPRLADLDRDKIVGAAAREAGSSDFGSDEYLEPLAVLLRALRSEANLHFFGRFTARAQITTLLANRAKMQTWWTSHPEILENAVAEPWFVVGLPRSGTTLMQHLLASDPEHRSLRYWEAARPAPPPEQASYTTDPRIAQARRSQRLLDYLAPDANAIHPVGAEGPAECVSLLAHSFASLEFGVIHHVPSHVRWCLEGDLRAHYAYLRRQLQLLQWRCPGKRWALKSPAHLVALPALFDAFPDARVIWMHRDPVDAVASHCSMAAVLQRIGTSNPDLHAIGSEWAPTLATMVDRAIDARSVVGDDRFVDVPYDRFVRDPIAELGRIYRALGDPLSDRARIAAQHVLAAHPSGGRGRHSYRASDFALNPDTLRERFAAYSARFADELA
jgi:hypothetical protein